MQKKLSGIVGHCVVKAITLLSSENCMTSQFFCKFNVVECFYSRATTCRGERQNYYCWFLVFAQNASEEWSAWSAFAAMFLKYIRGQGFYVFQKYFRSNFSAQKLVLSSCKIQVIRIPFVQRDKCLLVAISRLKTSSKLMQKVP